MKRRLWALAVGVSGPIAALANTDPLFNALLVLASGCTAAIAGAFLLRRERLQNASLGIAASCLALALLEGIALWYNEYFIRRHPDRARYESDRVSYMHRGGPLGYEPRPGQIPIRASRSVSGQPVFEVRYGFNEQDFRATRGDPSSPCTVLFLGDSLTFGWGLNDADTLPEQFSAAFGYRLNVQNLAVSGYGAHQVLRQLQTERAASLVRGRVVAVYYTVLADQAFRSRGLTSWNRFDPKFRLEDGKPLPAGKWHGFDWHFGESAALRRDVLGTLRASTLFDLAYGYPERSNVSEQEHALALYAALIVEIQRLVRADYGAPLVLIGWGDESGRIEPLRAALEARGVPLLNKDELLHGSWTADYLIPDDGHPSAKANREIAESLARRFPGCREALPDR